MDKVKPKPPFDLENFFATYQPLTSLSIITCITLIIAVLPGIYAKELFSWHPLLMTVGFLGFMREGLLAAHRFRGLDGQPRVAAIQNHMWVQIASAVSILLGFWTIYRNKTVHGKEHFTSLHGKAGLITLLLLALNLLLGLGSFKKLGLLTQLPQEWHPRIKWIHRLLGVVIWTLALVVMQLDLPHPAVMQGLGCRLWQAAVVVIGAGVLALLRSTGKGKSILPQILSVASGSNLVGAPQGPKHL